MIISCSFYRKKNISLGTLLAVFIVCSDEAIRLTIKDVVENINDNMPNYKRITAIEIMKEPFEKTTTKKIKRFGANVE